MNEARLERVGYTFTASELVPPLTLPSSAAGFKEKGTFTLACDASAEVALQSDSLSRFTLRAWGYLP